METLAFSCRGLDSTRQETRRVLVLNRNWQAVNIAGVKRAFSLLWQDHARVINTFDGEYTPMDAAEWLEYSAQYKGDADAAVRIRTVKMEILLPKILLLRSYDRLPITEIKFNRYNVFVRDNFTCQYSGIRCRASELTLDHVIPRERGGRTNWENIVTCRRDINERKANRLPHEAGLRLLKKPKKPQWRPFVALAAASGVDTAWRQFLHLERGVG